ncbi:transglycosylase SLT domain-containing protein [Rubellimicrobium roseum]|uniref:Lytic transglycosylase domain-containing protein n=1 Tax=Rubellimicrobium roseum TaxID=687525 RepID=A0A5C4N9N5_9RHOB|nr:transglycosylase SLT domain-containing protein [Rubellimicrobium roseum]TNC71313.1 lytic transglycosylase domain-containing protein [Rubellimicrobium roseum]
MMIGLLASPSWADDSDLCLLAAQDASRLSGVPLSVLLAISLTETGGGAGRPWPWTVNMEGEGHWFATRNEALAFAEARHAGGAESFDVGCFQINWQWHHRNFVSIDQMFDPLANATYAASFLSSLAEEGRNWSEAAGAFHSRTPEHAARYRTKFDENLATAIAAGADEGRLSGPLALSGDRLAQGAPSPSEPRVNTFPLLQPTRAAPRLGSLVPLGDG